MTVADAPTTELGHPGGLVVGAHSAILGGGGGFTLEHYDHNVELRFPASSVVYDRMRTEDGQVGSVARAITYPILNASRRLVGDDVRPEVMRFVERNLGIATAGRRRRRRQGIVLTDHLREALLSLWFGFMPFEQVYDVDVAAPGEEDPADPGRLYAHLRKLAPRMPRTLEEVRVARDGGLAGIVQAPTYGVGNDPRGVFIAVDRLVMYVTEREGAEWTGRSLLRAAYKHWMLKDTLIRLGAQIVERNGMGIPAVSYDDDNDKGEALAMSRAIRAGATAGVALKQGLTLSIIGVQGSTIDALPWVKYHDEAIGRSLLAMFLNLGHDNGARALGATFVDYFLLALNSVLRNLEETITEHVIRDLVELNYGEDEPYPSLVFDDLTAEDTPTAEALKALADARLLTYDTTLEADIRRRYKLPAMPERPAGEEAVDAAAGSPVAEVGIPALIEAGVISPDEGRQMLKLPGAAPGVPVEPTDADVVPLPAAMAADLAGNRTAIRAALIEVPVTHVTHDGPVTHTPYGAVPRDEFTTLEDDLVDRLAAITAQVTALRTGR